jgi:hypothetical protein
MLNIKATEEPAIIESLDQFLQRIGRTRTTGWRWRQRGWLRTVTIAGRPYITAAAVREFLARAESQEFAKTPRQTAKKSTQQTDQEEYSPTSITLEANSEVSHAPAAADKSNEE